MSEKISYLDSFQDVSVCPPEKYPEFAFTGRSNVGKSSLINMLFGRKDLAYVSKQPGKTQSINYFTVDDLYYLVDLPGYGYARHSKKQRAAWDTMTKRYFLERKSLECVFVLIDSNISPQKLDLEKINWFGENKVPFAIIFTKSDKSKQRKVSDNIRKFKKELLNFWEELPPAFITSAISQTGKKEVLSFLMNLANDSSKI